MSDSTNETDALDCDNPTTEMHPCPFEEEVRSNPEPFCRCCQECVERCEDEI